MGLRNRHTQPVYYNELYDIEDFIGTSCLNNDDLHAPTFLWDSSICEESRDDDAERLGTPVAPTDEAETVMTLSMQWYFRTRSPPLCRVRNARVTASRWRFAICPPSALIRRHCRG